MTKTIYKVRFLFFCIFSLFSVNLLIAQTRPGSANLFLGQTGPYTVVDKSNWSRYDNGKYTGHVYREVRASIIPQPGKDPGNLLYRGNFFVLEETLRDMVQSARGLDAVIPVSFEMYKNGTIKIDTDYGFPSLRGFPSYPAEPVFPGIKWTAPGTRAVDPLNMGRPVLVPFLAEYEYKGIETYKGVPVHKISARYATRYQGSGEILSISGTHAVDILIRVSDGLPMMMRDNMDETYTLPGGKTLRFRGFTLSFGESSVPLDREALIASIGGSLGIEETPHQGSGGSKLPGQGQPGSGPARPPAQGQPPGQMQTPGPTPDIDMTTVPEGIKLTLKDLRFVADSDQLLPEEKPRLEKIAQILKTIPDRTFLVEGHTAAVGKPEGEMELSIQRAKKIVDELTARGIAADRFIYKGWGGTKPMGNNNTDEGRRLNRRVEITILE